MFHYFREMVLGKGAGGLGFALVFPHNVKSQNHNGSVWVARRAKNTLKMTPILSEISEAGRSRSVSDRRSRGVSHRTLATSETPASSILCMPFRLIYSVLLNADMAAMYISPLFWRYTIELAKLADEMTWIWIAYCRSYLIHGLVSL